jgi:acyl-homoserine-lactone acylase
MQFALKILILLVFAGGIACHQRSTVQPNKNDLERYTKQAERVTIIRDNWGVPHIYGKSDADAVFGLMYAQCEENFERVENNYLKMLGRQAELNEENSLYDDLQMRLMYDTAAAIADYKKSPAWLKQLLVAFADGINFYLYKNPGVTPALLTHFEPWFPLMFTDGSIAATRTGGLEEQDVMNLYGQQDQSTGKLQHQSLFDRRILDGSNAFAIAPSKTLSKNALLYINPHTTFYFRDEVHIVSEEGLNVYGAATWGQFFIFQGFNEHCGWAHTASAADAADLYEEKVVNKNDQFFYDYNGQLKPVAEKTLLIKHRKDGKVLQQSFMVYYTHHGPVMGSRNGKWLSLKETNRSLNGLMQSWLRTKAKNFKTFQNIMQYRGNNSNNTTYADDSGNIAYWHGNFIPKRDTAYDWSKPADGSIIATEWKGAHKVDETIHFYNPSNGWLQNSNSSPYSAAGDNNITAGTYPYYMAPEGENFRSLNAKKLLSRETSFTMEKLIGIGYDRYLSAFDTLLPPLFSAYEALAKTDPLKQALREPIAKLKAWDKAASTSSIETTVASEWALRLVFFQPFITADMLDNEVELFSAVAVKTPPAQRLRLLNDVLAALQNMYGTWKVPWGEMNRYQRTAGYSDQHFDDNAPSIPVGVGSAFWGSLPSYEVNRYDTKRRYGTSGNSFVAVVEFGKKVKAKSVTTGGQSFDIRSKHSNDQALMFAEGKFKEVNFYKEDVLKNKVRMYHPGE